MKGNNKQAQSFQTILIPFFNELGVPATGGYKYFFPEHPEIDNKTVVGIEAHFGGPGGVLGEVDINNSKIDIIPPLLARSIYISFVDPKDEILFDSVPAISLYTKVQQNPGINDYKQSIQPYLGKIKTRACFAYLPANVVATYTNLYFYLTFYLR